MQVSSRAVIGPNDVDAVPTSKHPPPRPAGLWPLRGLFFIATVLLLQFAEPLLLPVAVAIVLTFVLSPVVRRLRLLGIPEVVGSALLVSALLASTAFLVTFLSEPAAQWWSRAPAASQRLLLKVEQLRAAVPLLAAPATTATATRNARGAVATAPPVDPLKDQIASEGFALTRAFVARLMSFAFSAAATVILLYFLLASEHWMLSRTVEAFPRRRVRALVVSGVRAAQRDIGRYVGDLALINAGVAVATGTALFFIQMPNPMLWGVVAGVLNFIPYIGPLMTAALLLLAGLLSFDSTFLILAPAAIFMVVHAIESNVFTPFFLGRRLALSPLAVFLSVMFWGWLWGLAGAMIAVPVLIAMRSICKRHRGLRLVCVFLEGGRVAPPSLRALLRMPRRRASRRAAAPAGGGV